MAKYWVYLNNEVKGPYEIDQLIRLQGFSRRTMVSVDDYSGSVGKWISPAEIPELARIFQKADELHDAPVPPPRPAPKPKPKIPQKLTPVAPPVQEPRKFPWSWLWFSVVALLIGGTVIHFVQLTQRKEKAEERQIARSLVESAPLPPASQYATLHQYLQAKQMPARWDFERTPSGVYSVTLSLPLDPESKRSPVYTFETNLQVQSVRGVNTAAIKLLSEGFPAPAPKTATAPKTPTKSPGDLFPAAINERRQAFEQGDFESVWSTFSKRRKSEMEQGGIGMTGFMRMQKLSYRPGSAVQQTIIKTKVDSDTQRLVLVKQTQSKHPDIYIKQRWVWEDNAWRLDDEEKKIANAAIEAPSEPAATEKTPPPVTPHALPAGLPGLSDPTSH